MGQIESFLSSVRGLEEDPNDGSLDHILFFLLTTSALTSSPAPSFLGSLSQLAANRKHRKLCLDFESFVEMLISTRFTRGFFASPHAMSN